MHPIVSFLDFQFSLIEGSLIEGLENKGICSGSSCHCSASLVSRNSNHWTEYAV